MNRSLTNPEKVTSGRSWRAHAHPIPSASRRPTRPPGHGRDLEALDPQEGRVLRRSRHVLRASAGAVVTKRRERTVRHVRAELRFDCCLDQILDSAAFFLVPFGLRIHLERYDHVAFPWHPPWHHLRNKVSWAPRSEFQTDLIWTVRSTMNVRSDGAKGATRHVMRRYADISYFL